MVLQIKAEELEEIARVHYRKTFVLVGFSSGYANWPEVEGWIDETAQRFNKLLGPGDWIIIYDGCRAASKAPTLGNIAKRFAEEYHTPVFAVAPEQMLRSGGVDAFVSQVVYFPCVLSEKGVPIAAGVSKRTDGSVERLGASAVYFSDAMLDVLGGVLAFGGGKAAESESRFAVEAGIRFKYFPCMDGKGRGFGPHHDWAIHLRTHTAAAATTAEPDADDGLDDGVCLSMHQPWASFVVAGIKRAEGRGWTSPYRGRLWIHAAAKVPDPDEIATLEEFYRQIYETAGVAIEFPQHYPTSALLGCVDCVNIVSNEEFRLMRGVHPSVFAESESPYVFCCENPKRLIWPIRMSGQHKLWNLPHDVLMSAKKGLADVKAPLPVTFPR